MLEALSRLLRAPVEPGRTPEEAFVVRGVIGSGVGGLNPAHVVAVVDVAASRLSVAAHAKEGLITQRTAQKAVRRVLDELPGS